MQLHFTRNCNNWNSNYSSNNCNDVCKSKLVNNYTILTSRCCRISISNGINFHSFEGYEIISQAGDEIKNPKKKYSKSNLISLGCGLSLHFVYVCFHWRIKRISGGMPAWEFMEDLEEWEL